MKYLYAFAVRGGFILSLLFFSLLAQAQVIDSQRLNKNTAQKTENLSIQKDKNALFSASSISEQNEPIRNERSNATSAFEEMKQQGKSEEITKRDAYSKHYSNNDGSYTAVISLDPIHFQKNGLWLDINTQVVKTQNINYPFINATNLMESHFGKTSVEGVISKSELGQVKEFINVKMYWEKAGQNILTVPTTHSPAKAEGNKLYYKNLYNSIDAEFIVETGKRKLNYIIPTKSALGQIPSDADYLVFSEDIILPKGWTYVINSEGDVEIKMQDGKTAFIYPRPTILENYNSENEETELNETVAFFEIFSNGQQITFLLKVDTEWLLAAERIYPLAIDPSVTVYPTNVNRSSGWVSNNNAGGDNEMRAGYNNDGWAILGYSKFDLTSIPIAATLNTVNVRLYYFEREGNLFDTTWGVQYNFRKVALVDANVDPTVATNSEIYGSISQYISTNLVQWTNHGAQWKEFNLSPEGIAYVQDARSKSYVTIGTYPYDSSTWFTNNYAKFRGYNDTNKPQMVIGYNAPSGCSSPTSTNNQFYIQSVNFVGSLIPDTIKTSVYSTNGYGNYTSDPIMAKQIPGGVINIHQLNRGSDPLDISVLMKAWVDWNKNGKYDPNEKVYDSGNIMGPGTIFGFIVPTGTPPGNYTIRLRTHRDTRYYLPCGSLSNGETEDYKFEVIADCSAKITAVNINEGDGFRCGHGEVRVSAQGTGDTTTYKWYDSEFGGNLLKNSSENFYVTSDISATSIYWVTAFNGSCESVKRTPVVARIDPIPNLDLTTPDAEFCGEGSSGIEISSSGGAEEYTLLFEKFDSGLGAFQNQTIGYNNSDAEWKRRNSPYLTERPPYIVVAPAIASGYDGGGFACAITDVAQTDNIQNRLTLINSLDASELLNLKLDFDLYYQPNTEDGQNTSLIVEASTNGTTWNPIATYTKKQGSPGHWKKIALDLTSYISANLKIRFTINSMGSTNSWLADIAAIDNIRIYGDKPLALNLEWTLESGTIDIFNTDCTTPYNGATSNVCIKPNDTQLEENDSWVIKASASLSNGCSAEKTITITNNNKVWNPDSATDWTSNAWKPSTSAPTADQCVIVKKDLQLPIGELGLAKNLIVKENASLTIQKDAGLTVTDFIHNEAGVDNFIVKSGGSLVQINDNAANTGKITAEREFNFSAERKQYNFIISPVKNQEIKSIYPGNPAPFVIKYVEGRNWFINAGLGTYIAGKGYSIKEQAGSGAETVTARLKGEPANGQISYPLQYATAPTQQGEQINGYNLVGNPYPSNLDLNQLYANNSGKIEATFQFWDNRGNENYTQQGSNYQGAHYAKYNAVNSTATAAGVPSGYDSRKPTNLVRPATAFMIRALEDANGKTLDFKNEYRVAANDSPEFFGKDSNESKNPSRYWLTMRTPSGIEYMTAVVYFWNGNNDFTLDDSEANGSSDDIYTLVGEEQIAIHGRAPFVKTDKVPLGVRLFEMGTYVISFYDMEGVFANGQNIYIRDKKLKTIYNLTQADYKFIEDAGEFNDRFEIIYIPHSFSADNASENASKIHIEKKDGNFVVTSEKEKITQVEVFALNGRSAFQKSEINNLQFKVPVNRFEKQIIVFVVETETGEVITKKFVNK